MREKYDLPCNIAQSLNIIGDRWTLLIIHEILLGHNTFSEIRKALKGISSNLLSDRLKYLEESGLITSTLYSEHPPRYKYMLTESGQDLEMVFNALILWGRRHLKKCYKKLVHASCQHEVEISYYCPHCKTNVEDPAVVEIEGDNKDIQ
ncbi:helix-turn-helix domain-containing protein [Bacillus smithii]|uniref:winged helix-turn-helix transcriptional regulator n=1 Tax=Bacillus smithii TaxID=1479 RepID=UPI002E1F3469|nr:helix-turn-helix domain-containing protein [Bacillus smithii]